MTADDIRRFGRVAYEAFQKVELSPGARMVPWENQSQKTRHAFERSAMAVTIAVADAAASNTIGHIAPSERPEAFGAPNMLDLYNEAIEHIRRTRAVVRLAEEMAPREAAAMLDVLAATLETARELMTRDPQAALDFLRNDGEA